MKRHRESKPRLTMSHLGGVYHLALVYTFILVLSCEEGIYGLSGIHVDVDLSLYSENLKPAKIGKFNEIKLSSDITKSENIDSITPILSDDGMVMTYKLHHEGASYLSVHFKNIDLPDNCKMEISESSGNYSQSVLRKKGFHDLETFWARHVRGDSMKISLQCDGTPVNETDAVFEIDRYVSGYADENKTSIVSLGEIQRHEVKNIQNENRKMTMCASDDKKNAICYSETHPTEYSKSKAVARLYINGAFACTGFLVSHTPSLLITNHHCIQSQEDVENTDFEFMGEEPTCSSTSGNCMMCDRGDIYDGAVLLKTNPDKDYALLELEGNPALEYGLLELDVRSAITGEEIYIPQHPLGKAKELAIEDTMAGGICKVMDYMSSCTPTPYDDIGYSCDTQAGSSGAPVLARASHKVIALHHCGGGCDGNLGVPISEIFDEISEYINFEPAPPTTAAPSPPPPPPTTRPPVFSSVTCQEGEIQFHLSLFTDKFPSETSWQLAHDPDSDIAGEIRLKGSHYPASKLSTEEKCIPEDCYTFTIFDVYDDGICCSYGDGYYSVTYGGQIVAEGGKYGASESTSFGSCNSLKKTVPNFPSMLPSRAPQIAYKKTSLLSDENPPKPTTPPSHEISFKPSTSPSLKASFAPSITPSHEASFTPSVSPSTLSSPPTNSPIPSAQPSMYYLILYDHFEGRDKWGHFEKGAKGRNARWSRGRIAHSGMGALTIANSFGRSSSIVVHEIDVSSFDAVQVDFWFLSQNLGRLDKFFLEYSTDDDSWIRSKSWVGKKDFENDQWIEDGVRIYTGDITLVSIRFRANTASRWKRVLIDDVKFNGII